MNNETAIEILTALNAWWREAEKEHPSDKGIGQAIDVAIESLKNNLQCRCEAVHLPNKKASK